jgi:hypothetical protein
MNITKQTWKTTAMKNRAQLNEDIDNIKVVGREAAQIKFVNQ